MIVVIVRRVVMNSMGWTGELYSVYSHTERTESDLTMGAIICR